MFVENRNDPIQILPIINEKVNLQNDESNTKNIEKLPCIQVIVQKVKKELKKTRCKVVFKSASNLKSILCNQFCNQSKLLKNGYPGVYQLGCNCGEQDIGETSTNNHQEPQNRQNVVPNTLLDCVLGVQLNLKTYGTEKRGSLQK